MSKLVVFVVEGNLKGSKNLFFIKYKQTKNKYLRVFYKKIAFY